MLSKENNVNPLFLIKYLLELLSCDKEIVLYYFIFEHKELMRSYEMIQLIMDIIVVGLGLILAVISVTLLFIKYRMNSREKYLKENFIRPSGASITHGMVRDPNQRGVLEDSQESLTWYSRLL